MPLLMPQNGAQSADNQSHVLENSTWPNKSAIHLQHTESGQLDDLQSDQQVESLNLKSLNLQSLLRLLMLSSTALPVGAYCYSQGVETAIEQQLITNEASAKAYFEDALELILLRYELPFLAKMILATPSELLNLAASYKASRETKELLAESQQLGFSLNAWIKDVLKMPVEVESGYGFLPIYAQLAVRLQLPVQHCMAAYGFAWLENQVLATVKTLPLGQMAGQRILWQLQPLLATGIKRALQLAKQPHMKPSSSLPSFAQMCMAHEEQYSRLYRS